MIRDELARPAAFPAPRPSRVEVIETHVSWVFLGDRDVYKVKKPVDLGFLDFRSVDARKGACEAEVRLNGRLAPSVYLGVVPVARRDDGSAGFGGRGAPVDWAVHMRRLRDEHRADRMLAEGRLTGENVDLIAERIAAFHASARCDDETAGHGRVATIERNVRENFAQTDISEYLAPGETREIEAAQLGFIAKHETLFANRIASRRVRDGHGDLRLEHVYLEREHGVRVIDCIEFADRFRFADVCADIAFLSMDLAWHGRSDLAERFLARYARAADDYDLYAVVDFYEGYRACVRGKIAAMLASRPDGSDSLRACARAEARRYLLMALAVHRRPVVAPMLVCVGGGVASGKSTVAEAVALQMGAPLIDADRTRKGMFGVEPRARAHEGAWAGAPDRELGRRVYDELLRRAGVVLASRRPVVLDASFRSEAFRQAARALARERGLAFRFVECRADGDACRARLAGREREWGVTDGRLGIFDQLRAQFEPVRELPPEEHIVVDTTSALEATLAEIGAHVRAWPPGLT